MTKRNVVILFVVVGVVAALGGWLSAEALAAKIKRDRLAEGFEEVRYAVETYAMDHQGNYPGSLDDLLASGTLSSMPVSPYTHEPMPVLLPGDHPVPGGMVYIAWGPQVATADGSSRMEYCNYTILVYGVRTRPAKWRFRKAEPIQDKLDAIAWDKVAIQLTEAQEYLHSKYDTTPTG